MGKHRQVVCSQCERSVRSNNLQRHLRSHVPKVPAPIERVIISSQRCLQSKDRLRSAMRAYLDTGKIMIIDGKYESAQKNVHIGNFGDYQYVQGNLGMKEDIRNIIFDHYRDILTLEYWQAKDGIDALKQNELSDFLVCDPRFLCNNEERWYHVIAEDIELYNVLKTKTFKNFKVVPGVCSCICSEISLRPMKKDDIDRMIATKNYHQHFIISSKLPAWSDFSGAIREWTNKPLHCSTSRPAILHKEKARLYHYITRRESSSKLFTHFDFEDNKFVRHYAYAPSSSQWAKLVCLNVSEDEKNDIKTSCKKCMRRKDGLYCTMHMSFF